MHFYTWTTVREPLKAADCNLFYPFFTAAAAYTADNLCTKQGNTGLESAAYNQERLMMARVWYLSDLIFKLILKVKQKVKVSWFQNVFLVSSLSSKKRTKTSRQVVKLNFFVCLCEETLVWKKHFEFDWPLTFNICGKNSFLDGEGIT